MIEEDIEELVNKAIFYYNRYRSPESHAEFLNFMNNDEFAVIFKGPFVNTCGINDWVEDLKYFAEDVGLIIELVRVEELRDVEGRIGIFRVMRTKS